MIKNLYVLLMGLLLVGVTACKKNSNSSPNSGNDTDVHLTSLPDNTPDGVSFLNSGRSAVFNLYAPGKSTVYLIGDFNTWSSTAMKKTADGNRWWVQIDGLDPNKEYAYQYYIDKTLKVADPYSHKILDPLNDQYINQKSMVYPNLRAYPAGQSGIVSVFQANAPAYTWKTTNFTRPDKKNLVIYELLVRDFVATHSYQTLTDTLDYIARLGVNAIELMPINEFEGNDSWGYNSNFMFALDKYYGTPNMYKAFVDACHARGIAVIQDIVLEDQFGSSPLVQMYANADGSPAANNPWCDQKNMHPDAVGYQLNHESPATVTFTENVIKYWMQEYHIDGLRFDEAKGFTQTNSGDNESLWAAYDQSRIDIWTKYNNYVKGLDPNFYMILEYFAVNSEETKLADQGMMLWTNLSSSGEQATMGYPTNPSWDLSGLFYNGYGFNNPYGLVAYFESHDEERLQFKNSAYGNSSGSYNVKDLATGLKRDEMGAAFMFSSPGPKMLWQFGELGYDISINSGGRVSDKPIHWEYQNDANRKHLYDIYAKMIKMKTQNAVFASTNFSYNLGGIVKTIQMLDASANLEVVGNFDVVQQTATINFPSAGTWYDNLTGTSISIPTANYNMTLAPGEYHVYSNTPLKQ